MKKTAVSVALLSTVVFSLWCHADDAKVEVAGVSIGKKLTQAQKDVFMFTSEGTRLQITIALPGRVFIGADREACVFKDFSDDKGTKLFEPLGHDPQTDDWLGAFGPKFSDDGKTCGLQVEAPGLPAKDATKLKFSGDLVLRCGSTPKTAEQKNVALKVGSKIMVGPVPMTVKAVSVTGNQTKIDLQSRASLERVIKIAFFDATGKAIGSQREGYSSDSIFGNYEITESYALSRKVTAATVKISYFDKVEKITVPINLETGLGIGS